MSGIVSRLAIAAIVCAALGFSAGCEPLVETPEAECGCDCNCEVEPCMLTTEQGMCVLDELMCCMETGGDQIECLRQALENCGAEINLINE